MIIYATQKAVTGLNIITYDKVEGAQSLLAKYHFEEEKGNPIFEWGCEMFYFLGKRGLQIVHAASGLTVFLFNLNYDEEDFIGKQLKSAVGHIFEDSKDIHPQLKKFFADQPTFVYAPIEDKALAAQLERITLETAEGLDFRKYMENGMLRTRKLNDDYNKNRLFAFGKNRKIKDMHAADAFKLVLTEYYKS